MTANHRFWVEDPDAGTSIWRGAPPLELRADGPIQVDSLPEGQVDGLAFDERVIELSLCQLEEASVDHRLLVVKILIPFYQAHNPARLTVELDLTEPITANTATLVGAPEGFGRLNVGRGGRFSLRRTFESSDFEFRVNSISARIDILSSRRPPYVRIFRDEGIGVWDHVTGLGGLQIDDLDLPTKCRELIQEWLASSPRRSGDRRLREEVVSNIRLAWGSTVT